jgi:hypothetical protein
MGWRGRALGGACRGAAAIGMIAVFAGGAAAGGDPAIASSMNHHGSGAPGPAVLQAAAVEAEAGPRVSPGSSEPLVPPGGWPERFSATGSEQDADLGLLLSAAGFADALLLPAEELSLFGDYFAAGWVAPEGDLVGLLFVVAADEPRSTIGEFVGELEQACQDRFATTVNRVEALEDRMIGQANATCQGEDRSLYYDMIFHFAATGTLGIVHIAFDATARRASEINAGLIEIFQSW